MDIQDYADFSKRSDWTRAQPNSERRQIAQYGIASEIGSLASAVKKKILLSGDFNWNKPNDEIVEEIGDTLWYVNQLADIDGHSLEEILRHDLTSLLTEIPADINFLQTLGEEQFETFRLRSTAALASQSSLSLNQYQDIAYLTARTQGQDLLHVCLTRLLFYTTVILSKGFPQVEKLMQTDIKNLPLKRTLSMLVWHISALAKTYDITLEKVSEYNKDKLNNLSNVDQLPPTALHDDDDSVPEGQRFPREFSVSFVSVGPDRLQMFCDGAPLGDELTDNSSEDDGYRFHDIMHLANVAKLGWSPVLRSLLGRKRKFDPDLDEVQDGARARIVEEAIVKAVHSEGERIAGPDYASSSTSLFSSKKEIPFSLLRLIKRFAKGLEVEENRYWEWQDAILEGHKLYSALRSEGQGTVEVNLTKRSLKFSPHVCVAVAGPVVGNGLAIYGIGNLDRSLLTDVEFEMTGEDDHRLALAHAQKEAVLKALSLPVNEVSLWRDFSVIQIPQVGISVKASGSVATAIWSKGVVAFHSAENILDNRPPRTMANSG
jgi:NTP pyrophosphatase (non-canonical NTP hydrolase)|tara:strand:+ start:160 stop:1797 length:1638 start_codon:yes stop_codon:yes gene_type:complete